MKRLWVFHEALLSVPLDSELGQELANQLLLCFLNANHIRRDEVRSQELVFRRGGGVLFLVFPKTKRE